MRRRNKTIPIKSFNDKLKDVFKTFQYEIRCDYDYGTHSCECGDDYCRCGTIENVRITSINLNGIINTIIKFLNSEHKLSDIDKYCIGRIFVGVGGADKDNYRQEVEWGYYGQELGNGVFLNSDDFIKDYYSLMHTGMNDIEKIQFVLSKEYGYVLDSIKNLKLVSIKSVQEDDIVIGQPDHYHKIANEKFILDAYKNYKYPLCVCINCGTKYKIIDGYHRFSAREKSKSFEIVVLE